MSIDWPDLMLPPINLYNVPRIEIKGEEAMRNTKVNTLPEPGIDVFVRYNGQNVVARRVRGASIDAFRFAFPVGYTEAVGVQEIEGWDYAVPAGDMLL